MDGITFLEVDGNSCVFAADLDQQTIEGTRLVGDPED